MSDFKKRFDDIQEKINDKRIKKAKTEERLESIEKVEKQRIEDLKKLDISDENLYNVLESLKKEINEGLEKCEKTLN